MLDLLKARNTRAIRLALILLAAAVLVSVYVLHVGREMTDFGVCYQGGQRILQGETLYRQTDEHLQYKYSPVSALFFAPLALLPLELAKTVWYVLEVVLLAGIFLLSSRILPIPDKKAAPAVVWTFLIELKFIAREIELGQVNLLIIFLLISTLYFLIKDREISAGALWGSSLFLKPYALVFLPYFLLRRKFKALIAGLAIVIFGLILPTAVYGIRGNLTVLGEWPSTLSQSTSGLLASYDNASLYGFLLKTFPFFPKAAAGAAFLAVFLVLAFAVLWMIRKGGELAASQKPVVLESAFLLILIPLFSPLGWNYNYLYSLPAVLIIIASWKRLPLSMRFFLVINFLIISTSLVEIWGRGVFHFYTHHALVALNFVIVLIALFYLRAKRTG